MQDFSAENGPNAGINKYSLEYIAKCQDELDPAQLELICRDITEYSDIYVPAGYSAYFSHLKAYCLAQGLLQENQTAEELTWEQIQSSKNPEYITNAVIRVSGVLNSVDKPLCVSRPLKLLTEIFNGKLTADPNPDFEEYKELFNTLRKLSVPPFFMPFKPKVQWEDVGKIAERFCSDAAYIDNPGVPVEQVRLTLGTLYRLLRMDHCDVPATFAHTCARLLNNVFTGDYSSELKSNLSRSIAFDLQSILLSSRDRKKNTQLAAECYVYPYNTKVPLANPTEDDLGEKFGFIRKLIAPHCQSHLTEFTNEFTEKILKGEMIGRSRNEILWHCAAYIFSRMAPENDKATQELILSNFSKIARLAPSIEDRALAKYYIHELYENNRGIPEVSKAYSEAFSISDDLIDPISAGSTISAAKEILCNGRNNRILGMLEAITQHSEDLDIRQQAAAVIIALARSEKNGYLESLFFSLDQEFHPDIVSNQELLKDLEQFQAEIIKQFGSDLQLADPNVAVYCSYERVGKEQKDSGATFSILDFSYSLTISVLIDKIEDVDKLSEAFSKFNAAKNLFNQTHKLQIAFNIENHPANRGDRNPLTHLRTCPVEIDISHSLYSDILFHLGDSSKMQNFKVNPFNKLDGAITIVEPFAGSEQKIPAFKIGDSEIVSDSWGQHNLPRFGSLDFILQKEPENVDKLREKLDVAYSHSLQFAQERDLVPLNIHQYLIISSLEGPTRRAFLNILSLHSDPNNTVTTAGTYIQEVDVMLVNLFRNADKIVKLLSSVEPREAVFFEIRQSIEMLIGVREAGKQENLYLHNDFTNKPFRGLVTYFPRNEPLFSLIERTLLPSFLHQKVYVRLPECFEKNELVSNLAKHLGVRRDGKGICSNVEITKRSNLNAVPPADNADENTKKQYEKYSEDAFINRVKKEIDTIIFSGTMSSAVKKRTLYMQRNDPEEETTDILLLGSGEGHNPLIITQTAIINEKLIDEIIAATVFNSGQRCTRPCSILIEGDEWREKQFMKLLYERMKLINIGEYKDSWPVPNRVGPLLSSNPTDWEEIRRFRAQYSSNIYWGPEGPQEIVLDEKQTVLPTIFSIPLVNEDGSYNPIYGKQYAPFFIVQRYDSLDQVMNGFFDTEEYAAQAMYVSLFYGGPDNLKEGNKYYRELAKLKNSVGTPLHVDQHTVLQDKTLLTPGVDKGNNIFGGYGTEAKFMIDHLGSVAGPRVMLDDIRYGIKRPEPDTQIN